MQSMLFRGCEKTVSTLQGLWFSSPVNVLWSKFSSSLPQRFGDDCWKNNYFPRRTLLLHAKLTACVTRQIQSLLDVALFYWTAQASEGWRCCGFIFRFQEICHPLLLLLFITCPHNYIWHLIEMEEDERPDAVASLMPCWAIYNLTRILSPPSTHFTWKKLTTLQTAWWESGPWGLYAHGVI